MHSLVQRDEVCLRHVPEQLEVAPWGLALRSVSFISQPLGPTTPAGGSRECPPAAREGLDQARQVLARLERRRRQHERAVEAVAPAHLVELFRCQRGAEALVRGELYDGVLPAAAGKRSTRSCLVAWEMHSSRRARRTASRIVACSISWARRWGRVPGTNATMS